MELLLTEKPQQQSFRQWVYTILRKNIINLHLEPGLSLSESMIAKRLDTSRTPVRESFIKLAEDGLIEVYSQRGSRISLIDIDQAEQARFARRVLEKAIISEACGSFLEECLFDLKANLEMQKFCMRERSYERMLELDNDFHRIVYRGCRKEGLWDHQSKIDYNHDRLRAIRLLSPFPWDEVIDDHDRILGLIRNGDPSGVDAAVDKHLTRSLFDKLVVKYPHYFAPPRLEQWPISGNNPTNQENGSPISGDSSKYQTNIRRRK